MKKKNKRNKKNNSNSEVWTEEEYDEYMAGIYGFDYIAGYTDSGVPYGIPKEEGERNPVENKNISFDDEEILF